MCVCVCSNLINDHHDFAYILYTNIYEDSESVHKRFYLYFRGGQAP